MRSRGRAQNVSLCTRSDSKKANEEMGGPFGVRAARRSSKQIISGRARRAARFVVVFAALFTENNETMSGQKNG